MVSISHVAAVAASCVLFVSRAVAEPVAQNIPSPTATFKMAALTSVGCFSTATPMVDHGPYTFQSKGNCQGVCWGLQMPVMGVVNGTNCWCGSLLPPNITQIPDSECDTTCGGIDTEFCGGANKWTVYLTGFSRNHIDNLDPASLTSSSKPTKSAQQTVVVTQSASAKKGGSTIGIVVGVIVGLILFAVLAGAGFIFIRNKKRKEAEEYKKHNDVDAFVNGGNGQTNNDRPQMWASQDPRLDTDAAGRRQSNGSIADNQDYSRRILAVRNPDGF